jgi:acyl carrier protein phosphodiesterase
LPANTSDWTVFRTARTLTARAKALIYLTAASEYESQAGARLNFLAHMAVASHDDDALLGGLLGDFVKGTPEGRFSTGVAEGIRLHRAIDSYSDAHPATRASRSRISATRRRFAGVIVDVCYDHFLARHWDRFNSVDLKTFVRRVYSVLSARQALLPERLTRILPRMIAEDWLSGYARLEQVGVALDRITCRLSRGACFLRAVVEIEDHYHDLEADFLAFFPDLVAFRSAWMPLSEARIAQE